MTRAKLFGLVVLAMLLAFATGIQQGYAVRSNTPSPVSGLIESVSNPSGDCLNLALTGWHGTVTISLNRLWVFVQGASPNSTYIAWVGYVQTGGSCKGTWQPIGSVNTNGSGEGNAMAWFRPSDYAYCVFELKDRSGNVVYGTNAIAL